MYLNTYLHPRNLHSFPTRRSSDLHEASTAAADWPKRARFVQPLHWRESPVICENFPGRRRSEEHTSELQSPMYIVCRLLLEKRKILRLSRTRRSTGCSYTLT